MNCLIHRQNRRRESGQRFEGNYQRPVYREWRTRLEDIYQRPQVSERRTRITSDIVNLLNTNISPILRRNGLNLPEPAAENNENRGLTRDEIERFPTRIAIDDMEQKCSICLDNFKRGDKLRRLPCLHEFHANCIDRWLIDNNQCPIDKFCCN